MRNLARTVALGALVSLAALGAACGVHHGNGSDDDTLATLTIDPPSSDLTITPTVPATASFTATATYPNGDTRDVTSEVVFSINGNFGSFAQNALTMVAAGKTQVVGAWTPPSAPSSPKSATATVIGHLQSVRVDPSLPANTPDLFGGTEDATQAPTIVYPATGVVIPRNLGAFEAHWTDGFGHDTFELSLHSDFVDVRVYVPGGNGETAAGPVPTWASFLASEWTAAIGADPSIQFRVRGVTAANPATVGATPPQLVGLSNETMEGGLYYWAIYDPNAQGVRVSGIWRHDMAKPNDPAEEFLSTNTEGRCVACHALSRDGTQMSITYDGGNGAATLVDVATKAKQAVSANWNFGTFSPMGDELIGSYQGTLTLRHSSDQSAIMNVPTGGYATHPDWSPDGLHVVYVLPRSPSQDWHFGGGEIVVIDYDPTTHTFGAPRTVVNDSDNNFYPSWSPDGQWILFNRSTDNSAGGGAYNNPSSVLYVVKADGTAAPIALGAANIADGLTDSWGRWAPFAQTVGANNRQMYWITVSSKRTYGVRRQFSENWPSIWMFPFYPDAAAAGTDPTGVAFRLPFQDFASHNHIAQWAEKVVVTQ